MLALGLLDCRSLSAACYTILLNNWWVSAVFLVAENAVFLLTVHSFAVSAGYVSETTLVCV